MDIFLECTPAGFRPLYDSDFEEKKKYKIGKVYRASIVLPRNYDFHKKFFALMSLAYQNLPDYLSDKWPTLDDFREATIIRAGFKKVKYNFDGSFSVHAESIAFGNMTQQRFEALFATVCNVFINEIEAFSKFSVERFYNELESFM